MTDAIARYITEVLTLQAQWKALESLYDHLDHLGHGLEMEHRLTLFRNVHAFLDAQRGELDKQLAALRAQSDDMVTLRNALAEGEAAPLADVLEPEENEEAIAVTDEDIVEETAWDDEPPTTVAASPSKEVSTEDNALFWSAHAGTASDQEGESEDDAFDPALERELFSLIDRHNPQAAQNDDGTPQTGATLMGIGAAEPGPEGRESTQPIACEGKPA